ncbi:MAG: tRNA-dihydrouridine synthase family protein [Bacteroidales bacterium]|nr:tRNA-dihydrouridine synthase family protein [Bacteroidales bacterium]
MILAPMQGLTELLFRRVYERLFPGVFSYAISPFISLTKGNLRHATEKIDDVLPENNVGSMSVVPQILGNEPEEFIALGNRLYDVGYEEVNWNIGCPMRRITAKHRGSGILPYPDEIKRTLDVVLPMLKPALSVKMRIGLKDASEMLTVVDILNQYPLKNVTIHPRLGRQQYAGIPDLDTFNVAYNTIHHPLIYNGDINTSKDYEIIVTRFPNIADVMVGRGIFYNPCFPLLINGKEINVVEENKRLLRDLLNEIYGAMPTNEARIRKTKEYWSLMWRGVGVTELQAKDILRSTTIEQIQSKLEHVISQ